MKGVSSVCARVSRRALGTKKVEKWDSMIEPRKPRRHPFNPPYEHGRTGHIQEFLRKQDLMYLFEDDDDDKKESPDGVGQYTAFKTFCKLNEHGSPVVDTTALCERVLKEDLVRIMLEHEVYSMHYRNMIQKLDMNRLPRNVAKYIAKEKKNHDMRMRLETKNFWKAVGGKDPAVWFKAHKKLDRHQYVPGLGNYGEVMRLTTPSRQLPFRVLNYSHTLQPTPKGKVQPQDTNAMLEGSILEFDLTDYERQCFAEILGPRMKNQLEFNISCRDFATLYENKADCVRMLRKALNEAVKMAAAFKHGEQEPSQEEKISSQ